MQNARFHNFIDNITLPQRVVCMREYNKVQLILSIIFESYGDVTDELFVAFMRKADLLEAFMYETVKLENVRDELGLSEPEIRREVFDRMRNELRKIVYTPVS